MKPQAVLLVALLCGALYPQISAKPRYRHKPLSDIDHHPNGGHDVRFDHEAFLGKEEAAQFDQLSAEDSSYKLSQIFDKLDKSGDGQVSQDEMRQWIEDIHFMHLKAEAKKEFVEMGGKDDRLRYEDYMKEAFLEESTVVPEDLGAYHRQKTKSKDKWAAADRDHDGVLSEKEYLAFSNPIEFQHMHTVYVKGTFDEMDSDGNGLVSYDEFARNRWTPTSEGEEAPGWLTEEMKTMSQFFDTNSDGQYDMQEFFNWLLPSDHDPYLAETLHLFAHADGNSDKMLSREEMLNNQEIFVGGKAAAYRHVWQHHQEL